MSRKNFSWLGLFLFGLVALFCVRWAGWGSPYSMNLDEELMLASVITMKTRGVVPWVSFDTTTIGPVSSWFLHVVAGVSGTLDYQLMHVLAAGLWALMGMVCVLIVFLLATRRGALMAFFVTSVTFLMTLKADYLHFNSEILPAFLLSLGVLSLVVLRGRNISPVSSCCLLALAGFFCSGAVLGKLQAMPVSVFIFSVAMWLATTINNKTAGLSIFSLVLGFFAVPLLLGIWLAVIGEFGTAWNAYFVTAFSYGNAQVWNSSRIFQLVLDVWNGWGFFRPFLVLIPLTLVLFFSSRPVSLKPGRWFEWILLFGWLGASLCAVVLPAKRWDHHGTFLVAPAIVIFSYLIANASLEKIYWRGKAWKSEIATSILLLFWLGFCSPHLIALDMRQYSTMTSPTPWQRALFQKIEEEAGGNPVAVWGWVPTLFAETNLPSSTRHMISHFLIDEGPARDGLRETYMKDLRKNPPVIFLDAVCRGFFLWTWADHLNRRVDSFPELQTFLDKHYHKKTMKPYPAHVYTLKKQF